MTGYDVIAALRQALTESTAPNPADVAAAVAHTVPAKARVDALTQLLARVAPTIAGNQRRAAIAAAPIGRNRWSGAGDVYRAHLLDQRVVLADGWKLMRDCTADDLDIAAVQRRQHAASVVAQAEWFEGAAALLRDRGARTMGDLARTDLDGLEAAA